METDGEPAARAGAERGAAGPWSVVVPLKPLALAKSRLADAVGPAERRGLALAFAQDTVAAVLACPAVRDVVVVTDDRPAARALEALGARVLPDRPGAGLNAALSYGARAVRERRPRAPVAALNADLPALRPAELARVLAVAAAFPRAFLADAADIGTTFLSAAPGMQLRPAFGGASRSRHSSSGAVEIRLGGVPSVRRDVDTEADLRAALELGVGRWTAARCRAVSRTAGRAAGAAGAAGTAGHGTAAG
ncbi:MULTISPECIES: 2-phospho-L-lactate guanylyltransferase [Streptomyces]|uniref:Phosphoenolpyruvate guanylyltransferase n=1 Tax=Streptomyces changanensis TaxID=2964669 RepID=A0ABY5NFY2_9ACTN|nr:MULTISPECIES: 2-phospho-L-lactate guanylyltransferase [Streptomyces]UUS34950.1 2-phospho-L-lactate guanylyltransferase [Streptomyces changanensis]